MSVINTLAAGATGAVTNPREEVVNAARQWPGTPFNYGVKAQCCMFVRHVFKQAGIRLPVVAFPSDYHLLVKDGLSTGEGYADSLAGDEVGPKVALANAQAGDIILFKDSYNDGWSPGIITHVGIYMGEETMIDRPTMNGTVLNRSVYACSGTIAELRRPKQFGAPGTRIALENGIVTAQLKGKRAWALEMDLTYSGTVAVAVNGTAVMPSSVTLQVVDSKTHQHHYLFYTEGKAKAAMAGVPATAMKCKAKLQGGAIHLWLNGKEIKSNKLIFDVQSS